MLNALLMRLNSNMPIELQDFFVQQCQANDLVSLLGVQRRTLTPQISDPGTICPSTEQYFRRSVSHSPDMGSWEEMDLRRSVVSSAGKAGKSERYKTELCRSFEETGFCKYKEKCQFAHGILEVRNVQRHPKYKTDRCRTYHSTGFCPYGSRCHFIHAEQTSPPGVPVAETERPSKIDFKPKVKSQEVAVTPEKLEQFLEAFNRILLAVSGGSQASSSPSPTFSNFEPTVRRQDSVTSGSRRSSPDRLPTPTVLMPDDSAMPFSRISSCSSDYDVFGHAIQSPTSPATPFAFQEPSVFSPLWPKTVPHLM